MAGNRSKRNFGRWKAASASRHGTVDFTGELSRLPINASAAEMADFRQWLANDSWLRYKLHYMKIQDAAMQRMLSTPIAIPNGTKGKPYASATVELPPDPAADYEFEGLEDTGLEVVRDVEANRFRIEGTPTLTGDLTLRIRYKFEGWVEGQPLLERRVDFSINPDPRTLWRNIPTSPDVAYYKPDTDCEFVKVEADAGNPRKDIVAASNRGRSHALEGKPRDDHFMVHHNPDTDWYILAVADGAGSARFSRKGSEIACKSVMQHCRHQLKSCQAFEEAIRRYHQVRGDAAAEPAARKDVADFVYGIVGSAALGAHRAIAEAAKHNEGAKPKDFATTLMLAICKKFDFGWFIASYWVGDGAMCVYNKDTRQISLLGTPDEGEYSGQTRFLTMPEVFADAHAIFKRLRFNISDDFTALMLMTDGVSDPMFGTDANLNSIDKWDELWQRLRDGFPDDGIPGVDLSDDNEQAKDQLLRWLDFWVQGEHDDRTIAILY